ncbi:zinc-binding dehydrogenase [Streptomyces netropsis]|uniref:NADPH:quinone reductase-like Zn-dependent oxidoreductase n=1 Tax=Streptomyces netropsis TaxID=55404 RepID=A0A7W7LBS8_STRNE|nr:zinc-binding dehydrogenase [Streptomyces netropsis]MBB4887333.1 NADPH:quinone reductase-like Zn-dependent oxidoreductase [Streptomyces netropsis]GGR09539.1 alcohol dehydrogenase [Streptomyces netropsis]
MTRLMRAAVIRAWGGPERLELDEVERPVPARGWIGVRVEACALNHLDIHVRNGLPGVRLELPHVSGGDVVGVVEQATDEAGERLLGRRVLLDPMIGRGILGEHHWGGLAEHVVAPAGNALPLPAGDIDPARYAALPIAYGTAQRMLFTRARLQPGETILLFGATGGVGVACAQLAVRAGARVIACSRSPEKLARLRALGVAATIDIATEDVRGRVRELTDGGVDVVVDYQGKDTWPLSLRCARRGGRIVTCGATTGYEATTDLRYVWSRQLDILGSNAWRREDLHTVLDLVVTDALEPVVHARFPLSRAPEAVAELEERRAFGKVVVRVE